MSTSFQALLTSCMVALGDSTGTTWSRVNTIWPWCIDAIKAFPILRPMLDDHTNGLVDLYFFRLPDDFRYPISVEYPVSKMPPVYLIRKNRLDPSFYTKAGFYDVDRDFTTGTWWTIHFSSPILKTTHVFTQYLANHNTTLIDDPASLLSVPDEYVHILIANVMCRAYRERLGHFMQNPTAQSNVISELTTMVNKMEESYLKMIENAQFVLAQSKVSPRLASDKFDRVY